MLTLMAVTFPGMRGQLAIRGYHVSGAISLLFGVGSALIGRLCILAYKHSIIIRRLEATQVRDLPTRLKEDSDDHRTYVKLLGKVHCPNPLSTPLARVQCAMYEARKIRHLEESKRIKGKRKHRSKGSETSGEISKDVWTKREETLSSEKIISEFFLDDGTGQVLVVPEEAIFLELQKVYDRFTPVESKYDAGSSRRTLGYTEQEYVLPTEKALIVLGEVSASKSGVSEFMIQAPKSESIFERKSKKPPYIISVKTESALITQVERRGRWLALGTLLGTAGFFTTGGLALRSFWAFKYQ